MPEYPWEKIGDRSMKRDPEQNPGANAAEPLHIDVNEGPEIPSGDTQNRPMRDS
jgi:hypothetical protein